MSIFDLLKRRTTQQTPQAQPSSTDNVSANDNQKSLLDVIVSAWQNLNADLLAPYLSDDFKYNSVWVSDTISGKENYLDYLRGKFDAMREAALGPVVSIIDEFGIPRPFLKQDGLGTESIMDFDQKDGRIVRMLMRPSVKATVVDNEQWPQYGKAYTKNLQTALQIAGRTIQGYIEAQGIGHPEFAWLQTHPINPSFQHICFRHRSDVYSILIAIHGFQSRDGKNDDGIIVSQQDYDNLLSEAKKNNLIPCIAPVACRVQLPMLNGLNLINAITGEPVALNIDVEPKQVSMSAWEINSMGVQFVIQQLHKQNLKIISYCDVVGIEPQIIFEENGKTSYVIVRSIPIGKKSEKFIIHKCLLAHLTNYQGYFADVQFASSSPILKDENGGIVPIIKRGSYLDIWMWRGDDFYCNFSGLQKIQDAISTNTFIDVTDDEIFDIK